MNIFCIFRHFMAKQVVKLLIYDFFFAETFYVFYNIYICRQKTMKLKKLWYD